MDPVDQVRLALEMQGAVLGGQQAHPEIVTQNLQSLSSCVANLTLVLQSSQLVHETPTTLPAPSAPP